jgi:DNA-directed RNA polymerase specialized sigma24 family protein
MNAATSDASFGTLFEPHRRSITLHCYRMLGSLQDAEEIAQETLLTIREGRVSQLTRFAFPRLFPLFGLPSYLASGQGTP